MMGVPLTGYLIAYLWDGKSFERITMFVQNNISSEKHLQEIEDKITDYRVNEQNRESPTIPTKIIAFSKFDSDDLIDDTDYDDEDIEEKKKPRFRIIKGGKDCGPNPTEQF